jgi:uncharacterized protein YbaP (TraB family)
MYYQIIGTKVRLAGSLHSVPAERPQLPSWISDGYNWSSKLALEHEFNSKDWSWLKTLPADELLEQKVPPDLWIRLREAWPDAHPFGMLRKQRLWAVLMSLPILNMKLAPGVETWLTERAKGETRPIWYLEAPVEFANLANGIKDARYIKLIDLVLRSLQIAEQTVRELHDAWFNENIHAVERILPKTVLAQDSVTRSTILDRRNQAWMPRILEATSSWEPTLVVVGVFHLVGPTGLLELLRQNGFEHTPVL